MARRRRRGVGLSLAMLAALGAGSCAAAQPAAMPVDRLFSVVGDFPLGTATNRVDYQSVDPAAGRLYIAKMGAGTLLAVDLGTNALAAELKGFPKVTGVLAVPAIHRLYASVPGAGLGPSLSVALGIAGLSSGSGAVAVLDTRDLHEIARLPGGVFPDGIAYDPKRRRIFVSDEMGAAVLVIDAEHDAPLDRIDAGGEVGNVRYDPVTDRIYAPIQSKDELAAIDPATAKLVARYKLPGAGHPHGLAIDPERPIGYVACDGNDRLLTVDLATGAVRDVQPLGHDPDVMAIDPGLKRLYVAAESGVLSSFDIGGGVPVPLGNVGVGSDAHSVAVDPATHRLYLPLADLNGRAVLRVLSPKP